MSASKRPSTSSLRRYITSRPYVTVAELRRRFGLDPDAMARIARNGTSAWIGLPEREATKLQDLWDREELGMELSVEVNAPVVVGVYPMRIARYVIDGGPMNGNGGTNGMVSTAHPATVTEAATASNGSGAPRSEAPPGTANGGFRRRRWNAGASAPAASGNGQPGGHAGHGLRPMSGAPSYGAPPPRTGSPEDPSRP